MTTRITDPIFAMAAKTEALRAQGADVITLAAGEPQAATSAAVVDTAVAAVRDPATHHYGTAQGDPAALRALVATAIEDDTQLLWSETDVQIALAAKNALFLATQALIDTGDEVLVAAPGWPGHAEVVTWGSSLITRCSAAGTVGGTYGSLAEPRWRRCCRRRTWRASLRAWIPSPRSAITPRRSWPLLGTARPTSTV
ncbi:aminotransferase class I/II-fold pyridoxal phosphate-dependent enzyme [Streptomyces sp. NBC_00443]|uniref:aminotransferase class I/II-fold pyridoxal phosphate-dependent enzyme n=1 Tax=Streptomyces sp. NBC_00443 TaxID=2975743 RepID=UPI003FA7EEF1